MRWSVRWHACTGHRSTKEHALHVMTCMYHVICGVYEVVYEVVFEAACLHGTIDLLLRSAAGGTRRCGGGSPHQLQRPPEVLVRQFQLSSLTPHACQIVHILVVRLHHVDLHQRYHQGLQLSSLTPQACQIVHIRVIGLLHHASHRNSQISI